MSDCDINISRLCRLIHDSLRPYIELDLVELRKEDERNLLVSLSQVLRVIKRWTNELDDESAGEGKEPAVGERCLNSHCAEHDCPTMVIANLICFLTVKSQYVQHLASNIILVIVEFAAESESCRDKFIHLLSVCFKVAFSSALCSPTSFDRTENADFVASVPNILRLRMKDASWSTGAGILRILHGVLKSLKEQPDEEFLEVLMGNLHSIILNDPWDLLNEIYIDRNRKNKMYSGKDTSALLNAQETEPVLLFLGNLIQLFCSVVGLNEASDDTRTESSVLDGITNLVPKISRWCLALDWSCNNKRIFQYFQHKLLMLMTRLSFGTHLQYSVVIQWLGLLHEFYQHILLKPISDPEFYQDDPLESSPFLTSLSDHKTSHLSSRHLQRQAIFLFLRCSLSLITQREVIDYQFSYLIEDCRPRQKGLLELYGWLTRHVPSSMFTEQNNYTERCINFASSFIKVYIHEDDLLFEVLLQLFSVPYCTDKELSEDKVTLQDAEQDKLFHIFNLFNPMLLFHLFLAALQYDHQLLLDYLISKDTGIRCAKYLLRCLRVVCDSWKSFVALSVGEELVYQRACKRQKGTLESPNTCEHPSSTRVQRATERFMESKDDKYNKSKGFASWKLQFEEAKVCLLTLKHALEKLHKKNLFPYSPDALLRRLTCFEELCNQHG